MSFRPRYTGLIERYRDALPKIDDQNIISLGEGNTPLIRLCNIPRDLDKSVEIYVKYEGLNPTGSFKDRGMTVAISMAVQKGKRATICSSTGNTSASAAAYSARAGITAFVLIPDGKIAQGKLAQAMMHGAVVLQIAGNFDQGMAIVKDIIEYIPIEIVNSINPYRLQGQKTAAFEIVEELGKAPDFHCLPLGNAGNISAYWMGYSEYFDKGIILKRPKMCAFQANKAAPFLRGHPIENPETVATAIRIGNPQSWDEAWKAQKESGGWFGEFSDEDILATQKLLAEKEGIFCEPASAISIAGTLRGIRSNKIPEGSVVVCTLTGHGLKDPDTAIHQSTTPLLKVDAKLEAVKSVILENMSGL